MEAAWATPSFSVTGGGGGGGGGGAGSGSGLAHDARRAVAAAAARARPRGKARRMGVPYSTIQRRSAASGLRLPMSPRHGLPNVNPLTGPALQAGIQPSGG